MKFINYISEDNLLSIDKSFETPNTYNVLKQVTSEYALKVLKTTYSNALYQFLDSNSVLYRGVKITVDKNFKIDDETYIGFGESNPSKYNRKSKNTFNYYTLLIDNLPEWKKFPKRSRSLICTFSFLDAKEYSSSGYTLVFPENGAKIGVCPHNDIWKSFRRLPKLANLNSVMYSLDNLFRTFLKSNKNHEMPSTIIKTYNDLVKVCKEFDTWYNEKAFTFTDVETLLGQIFSWKFKTPLLSQLAKLLSPDDFDLIGINDISTYYINEAWTDAKCLQIQIDTGKLGQLRNFLKDFYNKEK